MKNAFLLVALLAFAPAAHAQEGGHWETRVVTERAPGHYELRSKQVWQEKWVEVTTRKLDDGSTEQVKITHPGQWKTVSERIWIPGEKRQVERRVWIADREYVNPWDESPKTGRTEEPTVVLPSTRTERPTPAPAPRASLPAPMDRVERDPFSATDPVIVPAPAPQPVRVENDPLVVLTPPPAPEPARTVVVQAPERVVYVREPAPVTRVVYVEQPRCTPVYVDDCWPRRVVYRDDCWPRRYYDDCGPRVHVGVGVRVTRHVGVGVRIGF